MQQFFAEPSWITESEILIRGADLNHMKNVLRMKVGEDVRINDGQGTTYLCCLNRYEKDQAVLDVFRKLDTETELPSEIILFQGLPKGDKMEWIVQKSVELGAHKIVPFSAKRSVVKLDEKKAVKKQERWQLIAKGAAEQSGRGVIPEVCGVCSFTEALEQAESLDVVLIPYELEEGMDQVYDCTLFFIFRCRHNSGRLIQHKIFIPCIKDLFSFKYNLIFFCINFPLSFLCYLSIDGNASF